VHQPALEILAIDGDESFSRIRWLYELYIAKAFAGGFPGVGHQMDLVDN
jgi:hypothetical protein